MNQFKKQLIQQIAQLDDAIASAQLFLANAPQGSLRVGTSHNSKQFYWRHSSPDIQEKYIRQEELDIAKQLAQKDYALRFIKFATPKRKALQKLCNLCDWNEIINFHDRFTKERQCLIEPFILSDTQYVEQWIRGEEQEPSSISNYPLDEENGILTEKGELVRSKSEKILADKLFMMNIPYIYEKPLWLDTTMRLFPDFTVLNKYTRQEFYWEHFGMMDNPEYCENAIRKISKYQNHQLYQGKQLITTFETSTRPLNVKEVEGIIQEFLLS